MQRNSGAGLDEFTYDPFGQELGNFNGGNGTWWEQYVRFGNHIAWYYNPSTSTSRYFHANGLGSLLTGTDQTGAYLETMLNYPFGSRWQNLGFTWDEKWAQFPVFDNDIGLEMADNRLQNPLLGRWMTPDPAGLAAADPSNPQSFNRYAYALNNPTSMVDPSGLVTCQEFGQSDCDCPPDSVDCCDPFSGDPDCPIQGGGPIGGIGDGGGGSISSSPAPTPNCDLYGDPLQCAGIDFPSGAIAEGSDSFLPCVAGNQLTQLENYLLAQAAAALGTPVAAQNGHPIIGGSVNVNLAIPKNGLPESQAAITNSTPLDDPVFERGWHNEIRIDSPIPSVPAGAGTTIHILFNTGTINGVNVITNAKIHADIGDTEDVVGLVRHVAGDVILARIVAHHRGCAVKFGLF